MATLEQVKAATLDIEIVKAIVWCRLGHVRPTDNGAFERAKALGLLAQDNVWRATEKGEGVLVALGLLDGKPAPRRVEITYLWAREKDQYPTPTLAGAWPTAYEDHAPHIARAVRRDAEDAFARLVDPGFTFWTTTGYVDQVSAPKAVSA